MPGVMASGVVQTRALQLAALNALKEDDQPLEEASLILFTNQVFPTRDTKASDLVEATFPGYAAKTALVFGNAHVDEDGRAVIKAPSATFILGGDGEGEMVYGWAIVSADKETLYAAEAYGQEKPVMEPGQGVTVQPAIYYEDRSLI